ncbi:hypothetical protein SISSUDRAFT_1130804 [Sistotremastrum suecicum HHB10207 ss-3]|uniref:F-box domain-containing protein n=1 Tax=Sistotremastrum suecicum HHB10207 ss-3 TaxID=1314776 RepID=A0A166B0H8_9AGAM|nr:hypothetical protein SISSUDRAFT_1130804 [Sistotremastrum suecicum HHB10207 ss-3]
MSFRNDLATCQIPHFKSPRDATSSLSFLTDLENGGCRRFDPKVESFPESSCMILSKLPTELLIPIFHYAAYEDDNFPAIAAVLCRRWRSLALSERRLWASIWLSSYCPLQKFKLWTQRLGGTQVARRITISIPGRILRASQSRDRSVQAKEWIEMLEILSLRDFAIESFHFDGDPECLESFNYQMGGFWCEQIALHLEQLSPESSSRYCGLSQPTWPPEIPPPTSHLHLPRILSLRGARLNLSAQDCLTQLTTLELLDVPPGALPSLQGLVRFLGRLDNLHTLAIGHSAGVFDGSSYPMLPHMSPLSIRSPVCRLHLSGCWPMENFIREMSFWNLEYMVLDHYPHDFTPIIDAAHRMSQNFRRLCLSNCTFMHPDIRHAFPSGSQLHYIDLIETNLDSIPPSFVAWLFYDWTKFLELQEINLYHSSGVMETFSADMRYQWKEPCIISTSGVCDVESIFAQTRALYMDRPILCCRVPPTPKEESGPTIMSRLSSSLSHSASLLRRLFHWKPEHNST